METKKVLILEDKEEEIQKISNYLKSKGFSVFSAKNGFEGIFIFDKESPNLVILNWDLSGVSADQICQNFKRKKNTIPIIALIANETGDHKQRAIASGCDECLPLSYDFEDLFERIQHLLQKPSTEKLIYGDLVLDREAHRVTQAGKPIDMSVTEYTLLEYLMTHVDKILTRKMILQHVWGETNPQAFTNIIDVYINYLRKKIDVPGRRSIIKTVRGLGYMLEDLELRKAA